MVGVKKIALMFAVIVGVLASCAPTQAQAEYMWVHPTKGLDAFNYESSFCQSNARNLVGPPPATTTSSTGGQSPWAALGDFSSNFTARSSYEQNLRQTYDYCMLNFGWSLVRK